MQKGITYNFKLDFSALFFNFLLILAVYLPFEDFILKFLPVSDGIYLLLRQLSDFLLFCIYILFIFIVFFRGKLYTPSKVLFTIFIIFIFYIFLVNLFIAKVDLTTIANIKALLRYIPLVFIIYYLNPSDKFKIKLIKLILALSFIEAIIGYIEILGINTINFFFAPRLIDNPKLGVVFTSALAIKNNTGEIFGTMAYTISYSLFLVIGTTLWIYFAKILFKIRNSVVIFLGVIFFIIPIYFSGSRASFFAVILVTLLSIRVKYGIKTFFLTIFLIILFFSFLLPFLPKNSNNQSFWAFLSPHFIDILKAQRLGLVEGFLENIFNPVLVIGLGSNRLTVWHFITSNFHLPFYMGQIIEDVYWLALILYYGYLGFTLLIIFLGILYHKLSNLFKISFTSYQKEIINCAKTLLLLLIPLNFVNQAFEVKTFSFFLWIIVGLALSHKEARRDLYENITNK